MTHRMPLSLALSISLGAATAHAIVLHPDAPPQSEIPNPGAAVITQWGGGTAVAIAPNWFISSKHQGGGTTQNVTFGGVTYDVVERVPLFDAARPGDGYPDSAATDLVLWRIDSLNDGSSTFNAWTPIYDTPLTGPVSVTLGGTGRTRSSDVQVFSDPGGAGTGYEATGDRALLWGRNVIDNEEPTLFELDTDANGSDDGRGMIYLADFDGPDGLHGAAEATLANQDSGGGWFYHDGTGWKLVGLTIGVLHHERAIFDQPEPLFALALPEYAGQIYATIPEPATLMLLAAGVGTMAGWRRR